MNTTMIINYMEKIRYIKKISQEEFLHDITSIRQYQRYLTGQCTIPLSIAYSLSDRLGIPFEKMMFTYSQNFDQEEAWVKGFFNAIVTKNYMKSDLIEQSLQKHIFIDHQKESIYICAVLLKRYQLNQIHKAEFVARLNELVDINKIKKAKTISDTESIILGVLIEYSRDQQEELLDIFLQIQSNNIILINGYNSYVILQIWYWIVKTLGRKERFNEVILYSKKIIKLQNESYSYYLLEHFYYFLSLAYMYTKRNQDQISTLIKLKKLLNVVEQSKKKNVFDKVKRHMNIDLEVLT